jgi:3-hydroxyisobutyrate dehydrogenase
VARNVEAVFADSRVVFLMLADGGALDVVLKRGTPEFAKLVSAHVIVSMGSNAPEYSRALAQDIQQAGGRYVEAPVSGSRTPAEAGQLVCLLAGEAETVEKIRPLLTPMCKETVICGGVGNALLLKLAVNLYLNTMLVGLAEAMHFVDRNTLDLRAFEAIVNAGPMACDVVRVKIPKLARRDFSVQAATADAFNSTRLIAEVARATGIATPLLDLTSQLYSESVGLGNGRLDMVSVLMAIEARSVAVKAANGENPKE